MTERMRPLRIDGHVVHQIALPFHWGYGGPHPGDSANDLGVLSGDPNVSIQESKAFTCDVRAGRRDGPSSARLAGTAPPRSSQAVNEDDLQAEFPKENLS